jgi:hypothetical protein
VGQFADDKAVADAYAQAINRSGWPAAAATARRAPTTRPCWRPTAPPLQGSDCTTEPAGFDGEHTYDRGGETGRLACSTDDSTGERTLIWTDDRLAIETLAFQGGDPQAIIDWWRIDAGSY